VGEDQKGKARRKSTDQEAQDERGGQSQNLGSSEGSLGQNKSNWKEIAVIRLDSN